MELVEGPTLAERIRQGPLQLHEALTIARQIAEALEAAHEKGRVHRDLKPANIKITPEGVVKVLDFGLAKAFDGAPVTDTSDSPTQTISATRTGVILGTAAYMSPEQAQGKPVDKRADIWAFGCVLYEMLTGRKAFQGETTSDTLASVLKEEPDWSAVPAKTQRLLRVCLSKDPKTRLHDIADASLVLEDTPEGALGRRDQWPWVLVAFLVGAALLGLLYFRWRPEPARIVRFTIEPPAKTTLPVGDFPVVSSDGQHIAFLAAGADGRTQIWVRAVATPAPQLLPGTEEARLPFWSPDSRQIGFFAQGKLKRIERTGGISQVLADADRPLGGTWSRNGTILFAVSGSGLRVVAAAGGESRQITTVDPGSWQTQGWPRFLPDGKHFLYVNTSPRDQAIYAGALDSKESRRLSPVVVSTTYARAAGGANYLLFVRNGAPLAQRFDAARLTTLSEPVQVAEQVMASTLSTLSQAMPAVSASDNGVLAYRAGASGPVAQMAWFDRTGRRLNNLGEPGAYSNPVISPDGKKVAVARGPRGKRDIWVYDLTRESASRLTFDPADDSNPTWSPDGSRIAFSSDRRGHRDVYVKNANGVGEEELVFESVQDKSVEDWGRDGRFLLIYTTERRGDEWLLPAPGTTGERKLAPLLNSQFMELSGQLSPDGKFVLYTCDESGRAEVYVRALPPARGKWQISTGGALRPAMGTEWKRNLLPGLPE
jgi:Tol biopolymer transport system component